MKSLSDLQYLLQGEEEFLEMGLKMEKNSRVVPRIGPIFVKTAEKTALNSTRENVLLLSRLTIR